MIQRSAAGRCRLVRGAGAHPQEQGHALPVKAITSARSAVQKSVSQPLRLLLGVSVGAPSQASQAANRS